jgi:hypothetical protein
MRETLHGRVHEVRTRRGSRRWEEAPWSVGPLNNLRLTGHLFTNKGCTG